MVARALRIGAGMPAPVAPVAAVFPFSTGSWSLARYVEPSPGSGQDSRQRRLGRRIAIPFCTPCLDFGGARRLSILKSVFLF